MVDAQRVSVLVLLVILASMATAQAQTGSAVEEIVVTARKRAELLEDTPVSVTALGPSTLREAGVTRLDDIQQLVPNLQFLTGRTDQEASVVIRGVRGEGEIAFDPGVGIYVDGVYLSRTQGAIIDVIDVEQVEVLRGPQGTLFGKNTVGGAINITTVKPQPETTGFVFVRAGSFNTIATRATLNLPIASKALDDRLLARFSVASTNRDGYTDNWFREERWTDRNSLAFLGSLRFLAHDDVTIDVSGTWARNHARSRGGQCVVQNDSPPVRIDEFLEACENSEPFRFGADVASIADVESYGLWGTIAWSVGDVGAVEDLQLKSVSAWREQRPRSRDDIDMTELPVVQLSAVGGGPLDGEPGFARQLSQEVQANGQSLDGRINFVAGAFGFWEVANDAFTTRISLPGIGDVTQVESLTDVDNWNWALYGQVTGDPTDWLSVTAGLRYTEEKKGLSRNNVDLLAGGSSAAASNSAIFTAWTPMASIAMRLPEEYLEALPLEHALSYFTYSRGFRGGGFNGTFGNLSSDRLEPFLPETLDSFELGLKTIAWERRLTLNASIFLGKYRDIQKSTIVSGPDEDGDGLPDTIEVIVQNAASATNKGAEIELLAIPLDGLLVQGSLGLLDARFDEFESFDRLTGEPLERGGETFRQAPQLQAHVALQYSFEFAGAGTPWLAGTLTPRLDWYYQSSVHFQEPELTGLIQRGYNLLHARLGYRFDDSRSEVAVWAKNLTDEAYLNWGIPPLAEDLGTVARYFAIPRTVGIELSYQL
ncbi:MAG: TonB-dependent receptor [Candidatus Binatia bacterium]|nr:TonB-dependent receptor [Candidatus Binatia bacterium]